MFAVFRTANVVILHVAYVYMGVSFPGHVTPVVVRHYNVIMISPAAEKRQYLPIGLIYMFVGAL